jgi:hypothetical protein
VELANGSRILALPGKESNLRGFARVALIVIDEASRVPDELYMGVRPMTAVSHGRIVLLSTPFGKRGFFHHEWTQGQGWDRFEVTAYDVPRIDPAWLAAERAAIGDFWFDQEYRVMFKESADQLFGFAEILGMEDDAVLPLFPELLEAPAGAPLPDLARMFVT